MNNDDPNGDDNRADSKEEDEQLELLSLLACGDCLWKSQWSVPLFSQYPLKPLLLLITHITTTQLPPA